jgi:hypothetical protein
MKIILRFFTKTKNKCYLAQTRFRGTLKNFLITDRDRLFPQIENIFAIFNPCNEFGEQHHLFCQDRAKYAKDPQTIHVNGKP